MNEAEKLKAYLEVTDPLNNLEEFTMLAMNALIVNNLFEPKLIAEQAVKVAVATLAELHRVQNN